MYNVKRKVKKSLTLVRIFYENVMSVRQKP